MWVKQNMPRKSKVSWKRSRVWCWASATDVAANENSRGKSFFSEDERLLSACKHLPHSTSTAYNPSNCMETRGHTVVYIHSHRWRVKWSIVTLPGFQWLLWMLEQTWSKAQTPLIQMVITSTWHKTCVTLSRNDGRNDFWWCQLQLSFCFEMGRNKLNSRVNETGSELYGLWNSKCTLVGCSW